MKKYIEKLEKSLLTELYGHNSIIVDKKLMENLIKEYKALDKSDKSKEEYTFRLYAEKKELKDQLRNSVPKDDIKEIIKILNHYNERDRESVVKNEERRRNTTSDFYKKSYQTTIHQLNAKREARNEILIFLEGLLQEEN